MIIKDNSVEQINIALMDIEEKIKALDIEKMKADLEAQADKLTKQLGAVRSGLQNGETFNINIEGNAATADFAKDAEFSNIVEKDSVYVCVDSWVPEAVGDYVRFKGVNWRRIKQEYMLSPSLQQTVKYGWFVRVN